MRYVRLLSACMLSVLLTACGGGGSLEQDSSGDGSTGTGTSASYTMTVTIVDEQGEAISADNPIANDNAAQAVATLSTDGGDVAGRTLEFSLDTVNGNTLGELVPASGSAQTNSEGVATITIGPGSVKGAGRLNVSFSGSDGASATASADFTTQGDDVVITEETAMVEVMLLTGCNDGWDDNRDSVMLDPTDPNTGCTIASSISSNEEGEIFVAVTNTQSGDGVASTIVETTTTLGSILPSSGTALTDSFGRALLRLQPGTSGGAGSISATALGVSAQTNFAVGVVNLTLAVDNGLAQDSTGADIALKAGGSTVITAELTDDEGNLFQTPTEVEFSSTCATSGLSTIDAKVTSNGGVATSTYRANGCNIDDTVTVSVETGGKTYTKSTVIPVDASPVQSIQFVDVSNSFIALPPGEGGVPTQSIIRFRLLDEDGNPVAQDRVDFRLTDGTGEANLTQVTGNTDSQGVVQTTVTSGVVPGSLVVKACYVPKADVPESGDLTCWADLVEQCQADSSAEECPEGGLTLIPLDEQINTVSSLLTLSSGVTDQNSFDLSADVINTNSLNYNGVTSNLTVFLGDQFNQLGGDGVAATVLAEAGVIGSIDGQGGNATFECQAVDGACTVQWRSQGERPFYDYKWGNRIGELDGDPTTTEGVNPKTGIENCDPYFGAAAPCINGMVRAKNNPDGIVMGGRVSVLAVTKGQENFVDKESSDGVERTNGVFDIGEYYQAYDLSEAFIDFNENGVFDKANCDPAPGPTDPCSEQLSNGGHDETWRDLDNDGMFDDADGLYNGLLCSESAQAAGECSRELVEVYKQIELVMSGDEPFVRFAIVSDNCTSTPQLTLESTNVAGFCDVNSVDVSTAANGGLSSQAVYIFYSDEFGNTLPAGTEISISATNGDLDVLRIDEKVGNTSSDRTQFAVAQISREAQGNQKTSGSLTISFSIPSGFADGEARVVKSAIAIFDDQ